MPITRYYPITTETTTPAIGPTGEQSAVLPTGTTVTSPVKRYAQLDTTKDTANLQFFGSSGSFATTNITTRQTGFTGYGYYELGAQTIPAGTWSVAVRGDQSNAAANAFFCLSIYVWRPSTSTVVGRIYDSTTELSTELSSTLQSRLASVSGSSVVAANGDVLIVELWYSATQGSSKSYNVELVCDTDNKTDATADGQTGRDSWIDAPDTLVPKFSFSYGYFVD